VYACVIIGGKKEMGEKWDLNTVVTSLTGSTAGTNLSNVGIPVVAVNRTRFITYVKVQCRAGANIVRLGSIPSAQTCFSDATSTLIRWYHKVDTEYEYPPGGPADRAHPIFTIGASGWLGADTVFSNVSGTLLTVQYFDE